MQVEVKRSRILIIVVTIVIWAVAFYGITVPFPDWLMGTLSLIGSAGIILFMVFALYEL